MNGVRWEELKAAVDSNPNRQVRLRAGGAAKSVGSIPADAHLPWIQGWTEDTTFTIQDAVSFVLWIRDPLYRSAAIAVRRAMEMEEAAALLHASEAAWKEHGGRTRGWVRKHLEEDLRDRAAGADPNPNAWETVRTVKRAAHLVDYICTVRGLHMALWWPDHKAVTVIPAAPLAGDAPVVQLNCLSARILLGPGSTGFRVRGPEWPAVLAQAPEIEWAPPASTPTPPTVLQIQERIKQVNPAAPLTGGRTLLWNRLNWELLIAALTGAAKCDTLKSPHMVEYDGPTTE
jgi:hypothetical protein